MSNIGQWPKSDQKYDLSSGMIVCHQTKTMLLPFQAQMELLLVHLMMIENRGVGFGNHTSFWMSLKSIDVHMFAFLVMRAKRGGNWIVQLRKGA